MGHPGKKKMETCYLLKPQIYIFMEAIHHFALFDALYLQSGTFGDTIVLEGLFWRCALIDARYVMIKPGFM